MTTTTRNEAAERLRKVLDNDPEFEEVFPHPVDDLVSALAAERRATVERLREAYVAGNVPNGSEEFYRGIDAASWVVFSILDEEAAR